MNTIADTPTFQKQLAATRANLERLEALAQAAPDLVQYAHYGIYIEPEKVRIILADSSKDTAYWLALARKYPQAGWKRSDMSGHWDGELAGVQVTILEAEKPKARETPVLLEEGMVAA